MSQQPARVSHELEDFSASGIYPGGTNMITDAGYVLWDYNGKQPPNSNCAMKLTCQPTDGSNENKAHDIYWNIGLAKDFIPEGDGAFALGDKLMSQQCNWFFALSKFRDNCGLEKGRLSGEKGVKALIGSEVTFIRVPHERAEFGNDPAMSNPSGGPARPKQAPTILIPSKARFAWETAKGAAARAAAKPAAAASASTPPPASTNGAGDTSSPLYMAISSILAENDNAVMVADLAAKVTEKLSVVQGMSAAKRVVLIKMVNDPAKLAEFAAANGWQLDTQEGVLLIP